MTTTEHSSDQARPADQRAPGPNDVAPGNRDQDAAWNGDEGEVWAAHPEFFDSSVRHLHRRLVEAAHIGRDDHVLDLGCGNGRCTHDAARRAIGGRALGIDLSRSMLAVADSIARSDGLGNATFVQGDAQVYPFDPGAFDVVVSRTGSMFFADQVAAFTNVARALRPGGRLALVSWRSPTDNEWFISLVRAMLGDAPLPPPPPPTAPSPFRHADPSATTGILTAAGFAQVELQPLDVPMYFGRDAEEGYPIMRDLLGWMVRDQDSAARHQALDRLRRLLVEHESADGVTLGSAAWLITARRP